MASHSVLVALTLVAFASSVLAYDPSPLQDICVATSDPQAALFVNGRFCKDPKLATENDFFFRGLNIPGNTSNLLGSTVNRPTVTQIPGLNTLGISLGRIDYAPHGGLNPPHIHPRATELLVVMEGPLYAGFITSSPENRLFAKVLQPGDVFVLPIGLVHFQFNIGKTRAVAFSALGSQNPGNIIIANNVFGSNPPILADVLAKAFQLHKHIVNRLQNLF